MGCTNHQIWIGWHAEQNARQIAIPLEERRLWPDAFVSLIALRPGERQPYLVANIAVNGDQLIWTPDGYDMQKAGLGSAVILYTQDADGKTILGKSAPYKVTVGQTIPGTESAEIPDPYESWVATITAAAAQAAQSAADTADSADDAEAAKIAAQTAQAAAETARSGAEDAQAAAEAAEAGTHADALSAEGFAVGEQEGEPVQPGSPYYQNNAKHYANVAQQGAEESGYAWFDVHQDDGEMYVTITENLAEDVSFSVNTSNGTLEVVLNG